MKARIPSNHMDLSHDKTAVIVESLKLFIEADEIDGIAPQRKLTQNKLAASTLKRVEKRETRFNAEELQIMYVSILCMRALIEESDVENSGDAELQEDTARYLPIIDELTTYFDSLFSRA